MSLSHANLDSFETHETPIKRPRPAPRSNSMGARAPARSGAVQEKAAKKTAAEAAAKPSQPGRDGDQDHETSENHEQEKVSLLALLSRCMDPSWVLSAIVHMVLLLMLALMTLTLASDDENADIALLAETTEEFSEEMEEVELNLEQEPTLEDELESSAEAELTEPLDALAASQVEVPDMTIADYSVQDVALADTVGFGLDESLAGGNIGPLKGTGPAVEFYGSQVQGNVAVVFDVTASMYSSIPLVLREIELKFESAQVVAVHGATFKRYGTPRLIPYRRNASVHQYMFKNTSRNPKMLPLLEITHRGLMAIEWCDSLSAEGVLQSLGTAIEALLQQRDNRPNTIFVFSDFQDGSDPAYMQEIQQLAIRRNVKIVVYHPVKFKKDRQPYEAFAKATGGELRESLAK